jgi:serine protease Do
MVHPVFAVLLVITIMVLGLTGAAGARPAPVDGFADLAERLLPAVVNVSTTQKIKDTASNVPLPQFPPGSPFEDFFKDYLDRFRNRDNMPERKVTSLGSGFIISSAGLVVTNNHVIAKADKITVTLSDGTELPATIIGHDPKTDVALLQVKSKKPLPSVKFGDSDKARVGDWVIAIGNPYGLGGSVTAGIVSARGRNIHAGPYDNFIQTDAPINRGNSGGPLFNLNGEVIGINTAIFSPSGGSIGIGFSIPSKLAKKVVADLQKYGEARRGWLGVRIQSVTDEIAESLGLDRPRGALIAKVFEGDPAANGGVKAGDVIIAFNNKDVENARALQRIVADTPIGATVPVKVWRNGKVKKLRITIAKMKDDQQLAGTLGGGGGEGSGTAQTVLGMDLRALTPQIRERYNLDETTKGVLIERLTPNSDAAAKGLRRGDVIVQIAGKPVTTLAAVKKAVAAAKKSGKKSVLLFISRGGDTLFVPVKLAPNKD